MRITLNGEAHELPGPCTVQEMLMTMKLPEAGVVVQHNQEVVRRADREKVMGKGDPKSRIAELIEVLRTADFSTDTSIEQMLQGLVLKNGLGVGDYIHPGRLAVSGGNVGPSFYGLFRVLGRDRVLRRLERFLASI